MYDDDDELNDPSKMPLYQKGMEIYDLTSKIVDLVEDSNRVLIHVKENMIADAGMLTVKVAGAEAVDLYDLKMENAAIIRKAARDLVVHCRSLEMYNFKEVQYLDLIRDEIEEYRVLFVKWVKTFDPWNYVIDRWGLFNPPGVDADDPDPDDDIPFGSDEEQP